MRIKLHADLEKALLRSIAVGVCEPDIVTAEELSKGAARQTYEAMAHLLKRKVEPPFKPDSVALAAQEIFGVEAKEIKDYLRSFKGIDVGREIYEIARTAREKALLVRLINEAGGQLAKGHLDPSELTRLMENNSVTPKPIQALAVSVQDKFPTPPVGIPIKSLPTLSDTANGLIGVWIIGGEPGLGKSTLAFQIGLDAAEKIPVLYYDLDGTGHVWLLDRCRRIAGGSLKTFRKLTERFYLRESIATLDDDLRCIRKEWDGEILVVPDSLQTLPTSIKYKKESLDSWINKFKQLTKKKIIFVCVSEQNRAGYGEARMSSFKGTGDIEYAGSLCIQLLQPDEANDEDDPVQVHIVKNRHGKRKGHFVDLIRDKDKEFWFQEEEVE